MGLADWLRRVLRVTTHHDREASFERTRRTIHRADEALREHAIAKTRSRKAIADAARRVERIERSVADGYRERR